MVPKYPATIARGSLPPPACAPGKLAPIIAGSAVLSQPAHAQAALGSYGDDLLVSSSTYTDPGFAVGAALPNSAGVTATASSAFCGNANCSVNVWNNVNADANFGITSDLYLSNVNTQTGAFNNTVDGLRNLTGKVNADGTVTLYAITSTVGSNLGDSGADPNQIVAITDSLGATAASQVTSENFNVLDTAALGQVYRGVDVAPVPLPAAAWLLLSSLSGLGVVARRRKVA